MAADQTDLPVWPILAEHFVTAMAGCGKDVLGYPRFVEDDALAKRYGDPTQSTAFVHWFVPRGSSTTYMAGPQRTLELCSIFPDDRTARSGILVLTLLRTVSARMADPFAGEAWIVPHSPTDYLARRIARAAKTYLYDNHGLSPSSDLWHTRSTNVLPAWTSPDPRSIDVEHWQDVMDWLASEAVAIMDQVDAVVVTTTQAGRDKAWKAISDEISAAESRARDRRIAAARAAQDCDDTEEAPTPC